MNDWRERSSGHRNPRQPISSPTAERHALRITTGSDESFHECRCAQGVQTDGRASVVGDEYDCHGREPGEDHHVGGPTG